MLTQQLDGVIELQRNGGTTLTLTFSERKYRKRTSVSALSRRSGTISSWDGKGVLQ